MFGWNIGSRPVLVNISVAAQGESLFSGALQSPAIGLEGVFVNKYIVMVIAALALAALLLVVNLRQDDVTQPEPIVQGASTTDSEISDGNAEPEQAAPQQADSTQPAHARYAELVATVLDPAVESAALVSSGEQLLVEYGDALTVDEKTAMAGLLARLRSAVSLLAQARARDVDERTTLVEKLALWNALALPRSSAADRKLIKQQRQHYEASVLSYASVSDPSLFLTCTGISKRMPVGASTQFSAGAVWAWSRVNAPRKSEMLTLQWRQDGRILKETVFDVQYNRAAGYRSYYYKSLGQAGDYEVRLYNSRQQLIGIRAFTVH